MHNMRTMLRMTLRATMDISITRLSVLPMIFIMCVVVVSMIQ